MKLSEIIALGAMGYKKKEIDAMLAAEAEAEAKAKEKNDEQDQEESKQGDAAESEQTTPEDNQEGDTSQDAVDYKKLYEDEHNKLIKLQQENVKKDVSGNVDTRTDQEKINDILSGLI